ncbi:MAG: enoyl-CoA hydratase/isomerase family protein [bacterium]|nr:enoyl-CoA hydratase/isomerase family protein [bacterium]
MMRATTPRTEATAVTAADPVRFEQRREIGIIVLNRPEVHNAVNVAIMERLESLLGQLEHDRRLRVLILTGAGSETFSAGGDLGYLSTLTSHRQCLEMSRRMQATLRRLEDGPQVVIAALNGNALGGGCEIATACHLRIAASTARFSFRQAALGVVTGWGGGVRLFRLVGRATALRLLLTAETIDAAEALRIGLVDRVAAPETLMDEALALASQITANSPDAVRAFLELARAIEQTGPEAAVETETRLFGECWVGEDFRRRLADWEKRRSPHRSRE